MHTFQVLHEKLHAYLQSVACIIACNVACYTRAQPAGFSRYTKKHAWYVRAKPEKFRAIQNACMVPVKALDVKLHAYLSSVACINACNVACYMRA